MQETKGKNSKTGMKKSTGSLKSTAMGKVVFAFDFGEFAVKIAVLKIKRSGVEIRQVFSVENKEGLSGIDHTNLKIWKARIQRAFTQKNIVTDDHIAICTIGGKSYIHRKIEVPYAEERDLGGLVENEMSQLLALDSESYVFQSQLLGETGTGADRKCNVWAVAMTKETCNSIYELIKSLKLRPFILDIHANGIKRYFEADERLRATLMGQTFACIDYGMTHTEIVFLRNGQIVGDTLLDAGDGRLVNEAKNAMGARITDPSNSNKIIVSPEDICNILNKAHATAEERAFSTSVEDWLQKVNTAITRFNFEHSGEPVKKIYLYGGSPQLAWLTQYVSFVTKIPAEQIVRTSLFRINGDEQVNYSAYLNALNLSLMD